ncbi:T-complex protein 1 subunit eta-like [Rutidosis leptorrhynchoides]|uniref:T-complex protein 1 subunit eta-like n=1 Tax=Rutidosis leptorrhynchoides TaxID=125765 RepID=UPI003A99BB94
MAVADAVRRALGPRGMDKFIHNYKCNTTISNDRATIMKLLHIVHPATAKILVETVKNPKSKRAQGNVVGMGRGRGGQMRDGRGRGLRRR